MNSEVDTYARSALLAEMARAGSQSLREQWLRNLPETADLEIGIDGSWMPEGLNRKQRRAWAAQQRRSR